MTIVGGIYGDGGAGMTPEQQQQLADAVALSQQNEIDLTSADNLSTGEVDDSLLSVNVTLKGNTVNAANKLVELDSQGKMPAVDGSQVTHIHADNIATGTVPTARLATDVTTEGNTFNGADNLVKLDANGKIPTLNGSQVTNIHADNIATGTVNTALLATDVTTEGNTFNTANKLVKLDANGKIPTLDASLVTNLTKTQVGLGSVDNTSDVNKPVSTATQTALGAKANKVTSFTAGNVVTVDANGHPQDSGETIANLKDGWQGTVATFADLPAASSSNNGHVYKVTTATGVIGINKKYAGSYISNGTSWVLFGYKQASVIYQPLSGFTLPSTASAVTASDSILSSAQKIQKQLNETTYIDSLAFNVTSRDLTVTLNDASTITVNIPGGGDLVDDTSPQFGGHVDFQGFSANNVGGITAQTLNGNLYGPSVFLAYTSSTVAKGDPLYVIGFNSTQSRIEVGLAQSGVVQVPFGVIKMPCVGLAATAASAGSTVAVITHGMLSGINTSGYIAEDILYVADSQNSTTLTTTPPTGSTTSNNSLIQPVGVVLTAMASGNILVSVNAPNDTPNLDDGEVFIGDANNQTEKRGLTHSDISGLTNATIQGNTFNNANQLVKLGVNGELPAVDASLLTNLPSSGGSPDYVYSIKNTGNYTKTVNNIDRILYNTVTSSRGSSISLNTNTGTFTVAKGKTYKITLKASLYFRYQDSTNILSIVIDGVTKASSLSESIENGTSYIRAGGNLTYIAAIPAGTGTSEIYIKFPGGWLSTTFTPPDARDHITIEEF